MEYEWDFAGGEAEYKKAFEFDPNDATVHHWYSLDIALIGSREQGALAEIHSVVAGFQLIVSHRESSFQP